MKKGYIFAAAIGGTFFAVPYLALGVGIAPSLAICAAAYGAGALIFNGLEKDNKTVLGNENLYDILNKAKDMTAQINNISKQLEDKALVENIKQICNTSNNIIDTISKNPNKLGQANNFLNYYLPVTIKILTRYDEIENQKLNTKESQQFMTKIQEMIEKIKNAFNEQLNNLYQTEMIDTDAELKVFESMLKSDGFINEINLDFDNKN